MSALGQTNSGSLLFSEEARTRKRLADYRLRRNSGALLTGAAVAIAGASGITYNPLTDTLFVISDSSTAIYEYTPEGVWLRTITLTNFTLPKDITWMFDDKYGVLEETGSRLTVVTIIAATSTLNRTSFTSYTLPLNSGLGASPQATFGVECLAYNPDEDAFYYTTRKNETGGGNPWSLFKYLYNTSTQSVLFSLLGAFTTETVEVTGLHFNRFNSKLYFMSPTTGKVIQTTLAGAIDEVWLHPGSVVQPEGITVSEDGSDLWLTSPPNQFNRYQRAWAPSPARAGDVRLTGADVLLGTGWSTHLSLVLPCAGTFLILCEAAIYNAGTGAGAVYGMRLYNATTAAVVGPERIEQFQGGSSITVGMNFSEFVTSAVNAELWLQFTADNPPNIFALINRTKLAFVQLPQL